MLIFIMSSTKNIVVLHQELAELKLAIADLKASLTVEYLKPAEAAVYLQVSEAYLAKLRCQGGGPVFVALGRRAVRYKRSDLDEWMKLFIRQHTSEC